MKHHAPAFEALPGKDPARMRILVSNDDGIHAPGLEVLEHAARELSGDVWVTAPETEQSGAGHSLTLHQPLRFRPIDARRAAVSGTPTDAVLLGLKTFIPEDKPVDLVLSGVNRGANIAEDVTYSGTVAAAMEATILDVPAIALSQDFSDDKPVRWEVARTHAVSVIKRLCRIGWDANTLMNVNFPDCAPEKVRGIRIAAQAKRVLGDRIIQREDPKGRPYYWVGTGWDSKSEVFPGSDVALLAENYITVTPIGLDLTDYRQLEHLRKTLEGTAL